MREFKFRGKTLDFRPHAEATKWVYGYLCQYASGEPTINYPHPYKPFLISDEVDPATVGQFTGEPDYAGSQIFEGDVVEFSYKKVNDDGEVFKSVGRGVVEWGKCEFVVKNDVFGMNRSLWALLESCIPVFVIGNIHDNPELLEEK